MTTRRTGEQARAQQGDALVFCLTALTGVSVSFGGRLYAAEILVLVLLPALAVSRRAARLRDPFAIRFLTLAAVWFAGQLVTDLLQGTSLQLLAKGWALILFTMVNFAALWMLVTNRRRVLLALSGAVAGLILLYALDPIGVSRGYPWKFGYGMAITLTVVLLVAALRLGPSVCFTAMAFLGTLNAVQGFRSLAGICLATAGMLLIHRKAAVRPRITPARAGSVLLALCASAFLLQAVYASVATQGVLGEQARATYEQQTGSLGPLVGGRPDVVFAAVAVAQSPLLGHGSWAQRTYEIDYPAINFLSQHGYRYLRPVTSHPDANVIPAHSHLLNAWVTAGVLGLPFWFWALSVPLRALMTRFASPSTATLATFLSCSLLWDILFSPFGAARRVTVPLLLISLVILSRHASKAEQIHA